MPGQTPNLKLPYPLQSEPPDGPVQIKALADALDGQTAGVQGVFMVGEIRFMALTATPAGWLLCDGRDVARATYAALWAAMGTMFGAGDGSTTFTLPDLGGRSINGSGQGPSLTNRPSGSKWGAESVALAVTQMPAHNHGGATGAGATGSMNRSNPHAHSIYDPGHGHSISGGVPIYNTSYAGAGQSTTPGGAYGLPRQALGADGAGTGIGIYNTDINHEHAVPALAIGSQGGGQAHDNTPPSIAVPAYIYAGA